MPWAETKMGPKLVRMSSQLHSPESEVLEHQEIQRSLRRLDRSTSWFWWNAITVFVLLLAALAAVSLPEMLERYALPRYLDATIVVRALLIVMLLSNSYTLYHQRHFKLFRHRLAEQMQVAVKQRMRADKFYGMAIIDPLTGLYNRRYGEECLQREIARAEKESYDLAVIAVDLDHFKEINDEFGHAAGDSVLKEFSRRLRRAIRACDVPIRVGGDEFLVVLPECSRENVHIILSRLVPFEVIVNRQKMKVSFCRGRAQYQVGDTPQTIVQRADKVLYDEKESRTTSAV